MHVRFQRGCKLRIIDPEFDRTLWWSLTTEMRSNEKDWFCDNVTCTPLSAAVAKQVNGKLKIISNLLMVYSLLMLKFDARIRRFNKSTKVLYFSALLMASLLFCTDTYMGTQVSVYVFMRTFAIISLFFHIFFFGVCTISPHFYRLSFQQATFIWHTDSDAR